MKKTEFEEKGGITAEGMINALKRTGLCTWITGSSVNDSGRTVVISTVEVAGFAWKEATNEDTLLVTEMQNVRTGYDRDEEPPSKPLGVWQEEFVKKLSSEAERDFFFVGEQEGRAGKTRTAEEHASSVLYMRDIGKGTYYQHVLRNIRLNCWETRMRPQRTF